MRIDNSLYKFLPPRFEFDMPGTCRLATIQVHTSTSTRVKAQVDQARGYRHTHVLALEL